MAYNTELFNYRRPQLEWNSATQVSPKDIVVANRIDILFGNGEYRTETTLNQYRFDITRNAVLSGSKQSGLRTGSAVNNTWYALYAVKALDTSGIVTVGDTVFPNRANLSTLNTNFGLNNWEYLGLIRYGDQAAVPGSIVKFVQSGNTTYFTNTGLSNANGANTGGMILATGAGTTVTWTYASGTTGAVLPVNVSLIYYLVATSNGGANIEWSVRDSTPAAHFYRASNLSGNRGVATFLASAANGASSTNSSPGSGQDIILAGWIDDALGVGSNPLI